MSWWCIKNVCSLMSADRQTGLRFIVININNKHQTSNNKHLLYLHLLSLHLLADYFFNFRFQRGALL